MKLAYLIFSLIGFCLESEAIDKKKFKPVSVSYESVIKCYPEFKSQELVAKVDFQILRRIIDEKYPTLRSYLRFRRVQFKTAQSTTQILTLFSEGESIQKATVKMTLEVLDVDGRSTEAIEARRVNPTPNEINIHLQGAKIESDEVSFIDIKSNDTQLRHTSKDGQLVEIVLSDSKKRLACESQKDLGIICSCSRKNS